MDSYYSLLKGHNWDGVYELLTPEHKKKIGSPEKVATVMAPTWNPTHSFSIKVNQVVETGPLCVASGALWYTYKVRGALPEVTEDEYFSWTLRKQADGKWYIELPGSEKVRSW
jgi:ketosteroid isomerase-like protein